MRRVYLGIDQGTTGVTALALGCGDFRLLGRGYCRIRSIFPHPGWVEHDPEEIWQAVLKAVGEALRQADAEPAQVACIGLDHEGETCLFYDRRTARPLTPAVVWQDRRTEAALRSLAQEDARTIRRVTGLLPDAYFSAPKLRWLLDHTEGLSDRAARGEAAAGNLDSWLLCRMTAGRACATDVSTASRTLLMDLERGAWDAQMAARFGVPTALLPEIRDSACRFGVTDAASFLGIEAPVTAMMTDQQAALFGEGCFSPGDTKVTLGTGGFVYRNIGTCRPADDGQVLATAAWRLNGIMTYALSGDIYIAGAAVNWLRSLGLVDDPAQTEAMARSAEDSGLMLVPAFSGLAAPYWDSTAGGLLIGLHGGTTKEQIVRAALESTAFQVADVLGEMDRVTGVRTVRLKADGGMTGNAFLMQTLADLTGCEIAAAGMADATAEGAARAAALGNGDFASVRELPPPALAARSFLPAQDAQTRAARLELWRRAVARSLHWQAHT